MTSVAVTSVVIAVASIVLATCMYLRQQQPLADKLAKRFAGLHRAAYHRFYIDEVYQFITTPDHLQRCISAPIAWFDRHMVDGFHQLHGLGYPCYE